MGLLEEIDSLELDDATKARLRQEYSSEVEPLREDNTTLRRDTRREQVETEVQELSDAGFSDAPGALAFYRRVQLSDDGEAGIVLMSDAQLNLSGDQATGARTEEDMSAGEVLRHFLSLLPRNHEGALRIVLSDQANEGDDHGRPDNAGDGDGENNTEKRRQDASKWVGRDLTKPRTRSRYRRDAVPAGGGS